MTGMNEREAAFEKKFARDAELRFAVEARCARLFGLWAAQKLGLGTDQAETYARNLVAANLEEAGFEDILRPVRADFQAKGVKIAEPEIQQALDKASQAAKEQIMEERP